MNEKKWLNEKGSISLEFIGVLPFFFMFMLLIFQGFALGYAFVTTQSAVNEAAKVFAEGDTYDEAKAAANKILGNGTMITLKDFEIKEYDPASIDQNFKAELDVNIQLLFIPDKWRNVTSLDFTESVHSRVIQ